MYVKHILLFFTCCCMAFTVQAQQRVMVKGVLYKAQSAIRVGQALVSNTKTGTVMMSDDLGIFSIPAVTGDTLLITKKGYAAYKHAVKGTTDILIYLDTEQVIELNEVTIRGISKSRELTDVLWSYRGQGSLFLGKPPALSFLASPITGFYELFGRTPKRARHFAAFAKAELEQDVVNKRYNLEFVKRVLNLDDAQAQKFMDYYTPSFEDTKEWNDYEMVKRVKRQYEYFKKQRPAKNPLTGQ